MGQLSTHKNLLSQFMLGVWLLGVMLGISMPQTVFAQQQSVANNPQQTVTSVGISQYAASLVPCGQTGPDGSIQNPCGYDDLIDLVNNIIQWMIGLLTTLGTLLFMYAGFLYLTAGSDSGQTEDAKEIFANVAMGFALVLLSVTLVTTLVTQIADDSSGGWLDTFDEAIPLIELSYTESNQVIDSIT